MPEKDIAIRLQYLTEGAERAKAIAEDIDKTVLAGRGKALDLNRQILDQRKALTTTTDKGWRTRRESLISELRLQREGVAQDVQEQRLLKDRLRPIQAATQAELKAAKTEQMATTVRETYLRYSYLSGIALNEMGKAFGKTNAEIQANGEIIHKVTRRTMTADDVVTELKGTHKRFRMELLSVMFAGMAVSKAYDSMIKPAKELTGQTQMWTTTMQVAFLPIVSATTPAVLKLQTSIMKLSSEHQRFMTGAGGVVMLVGWLGKGMMTVGMFGLGIDGLRQTISRTSFAMKAHNELMVAMTGKQSALAQKQGLLRRGIDRLKEGVKTAGGAVVAFGKKLWDLRPMQHQRGMAMLSFAFTGLTAGLKAAAVGAKTLGGALWGAISPILIPLLIISAIVVAIILLFTHWGQIVGWLTEKWVAFKEYIGEKVEAVVDWGKEKLEALEEKWEAFKALIGEKVSALIEWGRDKLEILREGWETFKANVTTKVAAAVEWGKEKLGELKEEWEDLKKDLAAHKEAAIDWTKSKLDALREKWDSLVSNLAELKTAAINWTKDKLDALRTKWDELVADLRVLKVAAIDWGKSKLEEIIKLWEDFKKKLTEKIETKIETTQTIYRNIVETVSRIWKGQHGGIVTKPTFSLIGEAGPEAVIPLNKMEGMTKAGSVTLNYTPTYNITTTSEFDLDEKLREHDRELVSQIQALVRR